MLANQSVLKPNLRLLMVGAIAFSIAILSACSIPATTVSQTSPISTEHGEMMHMNHSMEMDLGPADADYDLRFIDGMIPHHEGAIAMARDALNKSQRPEIKQLANDIITSQQVEIDHMKVWRRAWYNQ